QFAQNLAAPSSEPQPVQNFLAGDARAEPHSWQNLPAGTIALHLAHCTLPPAAVGAVGWAPPWTPGGWDCGPCGPALGCMKFALPIPTATWAPSPATPASPPPFAIPSPAPIIALPAA